MTKSSNTVLPKRRLLRGSIAISVAEKEEIMEEIASVLKNKWLEFYTDAQLRCSGKSTWCPYHRTCAASPIDGKSCERYDVVGTQHVNELVLKHCCGRKNETSGPSACVVSPVRPIRPEAPPLFEIDKYCFQFIKSIVHPLHNYLQLHKLHHNADEIQVLLMPRHGPIADADRLYRSGTAPLRKSASRKRSREGSADACGWRHCYVATNTESLPEEVLCGAVAGWGTPSVFQIDGFTVIRGEAGRHAELKLLDFLSANIMPLCTAPGGTTGTKKAIAADERALIVGERFPCVACRVMAIPHEAYAQLLPSHGHFYVTTAAKEIQYANGSSHGDESGGSGDSSKPKGGHSMAHLLYSPTEVHKLLKKGKGRVLLT